MKRGLAGLVLAALLGGCAGLEDAAPSGGRRGEGHRGRREASKFGRRADPAAAWDTLAARIRRGEAPAVLADAQRDAAEAEAASEPRVASVAHTGAAYAALRLSRYDLAIREGRAAVSAADETGDWRFRDAFAARGHRFVGMALRHLGRLPEAERQYEAALAAAQSRRGGRTNIGVVSNIRGSLAALAAARGDHATAARYAEES